MATMMIAKTYLTSLTTKTAVATTTTTTTTLTKTTMTEAMESPCPPSTIMSSQYPPSNPLAKARTMATLAMQRRLFH